MKNEKCKINKVMNITVTWGVGTGSTKLSSFDKALWDAGVANYNLLCLSSIIPPGSKITIKKANFQNIKKDFGKRLYVVMSSNIISKKGESAFAGVGWCLSKKEQKGLFVEHKGRSRKEVLDLIKNSLSDMTKYRKEKYGKINYKITGIKCQGKPVTALVCAVYMAEGWS